jgi:chromosome segregation ATPase
MNEDDKTTAGGRRRRRMMMRVTFCGVLLLLAVPAYGQTDGAILDELRALNGTMKEIATSLSRNAEHQRLQLLIKRLEMMSARQLSHDRTVQTLAEERRNVSEHRRRTADALAILEEQSSRGVMQAEEAETGIKQLRAELKSADERLESISSRLSAAEAVAREQAEEVRGWEAYLDRELRMR